MIVTKDEQLALLAAMDKQISGPLKAAKQEARDSLMDAFAETHCDRRAIMVGDSKVGEVGMSFSTAQPVIKAERHEAAMRYLMERGLAEIVPARGWEKHFAQAGEAVIDVDTGEAVDFLYWQGRTPRTVTVRGCKPKDVMDAFGPRLDGQTVTGLLEGEVS